MVMMPSSVIAFPEKNNCWILMNTFSRTCLAVDSSAMKILHDVCNLTLDELYLKYENENWDIWDIEWFEQNTSIQKDEIIKNLEENYLELGWIDSLKFISFITDIEEKFKIRFSNDSFQDRNFSTVKGLSKIVREYVDGKI